MKTFDSIPAGTLFRFSGEKTVYQKKGEGQGYIIVKHPTGRWINQRVDIKK